MKIDPKPPHGREPRKGKKLSSAASNVAQAKKKVEQEGKIGSITQTRFEHGVDPKTGEPTLIAIFPRDDGREPHKLDLSFLLGFPNLQPMFAEAFLCWGRALSPRTRVGCRFNLRHYFFAYLRSDWTNTLHPEEIDDELLCGFRDSLLSKSGRRSRPIHPNTVADALGALRAVLKKLDTGPWACAASRIAERIPPGPAGAVGKGTPTEVLRMDQLLAILEAAEQAVLSIIKRFEKARELLAEGREKLRDPARVMNGTRTDYNDLAVCLAAVDEACPGVIPELKVLQAMDPAKGWAVQCTHGQREINSYFYASGLDLVPFALLLTIATVFNPDTVLSLNWGDIDFNKDRAGTNAIEIVGFKGRASRDQVRLLDPDSAVSSDLSLKQVLICLREITERIRPYLPPEHADRLFVYVQQVGTKRPKGYGSVGEKISATSIAVWTYSLNKFIRDNKLPQFTLGQLRPTILDLTQFMDGSLEAARKVGNHGSPATTWTHYTSGGVRARYRERIGQVIVLRERWLQTGGRIDPRRLVPGQDKGAATPGFSCLDPFDSPRPNQQKGRLCKDYGGCPSCALAVAHPNDPQCVGFYTALEAAIYRSQGEMSARTWIERWAPVLADLAALREWIPPGVMKESYETFTWLPNVG